MSQGSLFLNLSRGFVVDHGALRAEIEGGRIAGAAVDVFPEEPSARGEEFVSELRGLENVILTPHVGGSTEEAQQDIGHFVAGKLRDYVEAGVTTLSVNLPSVALALPRTSNTATGCCTCTTTLLASSPRSSACWPSTRSISSGSCSAPGVSTATS